MANSLSGSQLSSIIEYETQSGRNKSGAFVPASFNFKVRSTDIAGGVNQLCKNGREESWMVFLFDTPNSSEITEDRSLELQYSFFGGRVGLEWVLIGPRNVADEQIVTEFIRQRGHQVERIVMNQVEFLRVEDGDLSELGENILESLYGVSPNAELGLIIDGIVLSYGKRSNL